MDPTLTQQQREFRGEVRAFLAEPRVRKAVEEIARYRPREEPAILEVYRWLGERGWLAASWPVEFGGLGKTRRRSGDPSPRRWPSPGYPTTRMCCRSTSSVCSC
jgi:alkylation response protein AidB-like acyl-CoA dehydrogenase